MTFRLVLCIGAFASGAGLWAWGFVRPGSLLRRGVREVRALPWWVYFGGAIGVFVAEAFGASAGLLAPGGRDDPMALALAQVGGNLASVVAGVILMLALRARVDGRVVPEGFEFGVRPRDVGAAAAWLGGGVFCIYMVVSMVAMALAQKLGGQEPPQIAHDTLREIADHRGDAVTWLLAFGAVVAAPASEELIFRVFLQSGVLALTRRPGLSVVLTSVVFAAVHLGNGVPLNQWYALAQLFVLALGLGTAYEWTKRPVVPILMHAAFNAFNVALVASG